MGFYGNITNTSRTQFQFDLVYPSRNAMENGCAKDGVYVGRYVLVDYDRDPNNQFKIGYRKGKLVDFKDGKDFLYSSKNLEEISKINYVEDEYWDYENNTTDIIKGVTKGTVVKVEETETQYRVYDENGEPISTKDENVLIEAGEYSLFICTDKVTVEEEQLDGTGEPVIVIKNYALFKKQLEDKSESNYIVNYNKDKDYYKTENIGRGWDSTVWQKVYENGLEKYVMIAELNGVVPTFDVQADAPSMSPITPHFDEISTNTYYRLHWQPQWGMRTRAAAGDLQTPQINRNGEALDKLSNPDIYASSSVDLGKSPAETYPSDAITRWEKYEYNTLTGKQEKLIYNKNTQDWEAQETNLDKEDSRYDINAAIFWNDAGFDPKVVSNTTQNRNEKNQEWDGKTDFISIKPTGWSGHQYSPHDGLKAKEPNMNPAPDTQEIMVMLPSIGNAISEVWDVMYGDININGGENRNLNIDWIDPQLGEIQRTGLRLIRDKYEPISLTKESYKPNFYYVKDEIYPYIYNLVNDEEYNPNFNYFVRTSVTYKPKEINTVAGAINSVHDLLGMIIVDRGVNDPELDAVGELSLDRIYYYPLDGTFRIKDFQFKYAPLGENMFKYELFNGVTSLGKVTKDEFVPQILYISPEENVYIALTDNANYEDYKDEIFYVKKLTIEAEEELFKEISLDIFKNGHYRTFDGSYIYKDGGTPDNGVIYYQVNRDKLGTPKTFEYNYEDNRFYYKENDVFILLNKNTRKNDLDTQKPFYDISQELSKNVHQYVNSIDDISLYTFENQEGPYTPKEGYWDETTQTIIKDKGIYPTYFFTLGMLNEYGPYYVQAGEDEEVNVAGNWKRLAKVPDDGFAYILDRPRVNTTMGSENPSYGDPVSAYKIKLIDYDALDDSIKDNLYYPEMEKYTEDILNEEGQIETIEKTRFNKWIKVSKEHIDTWYKGLGLRNGLGAEADVLKPTHPIYYINPGEIINDLYEPNKYYYEFKHDNGVIDYIRDRNTTFNKSGYYDQAKFEPTSNFTVLTPLANSGEYYVPNKYYYKVEVNYGDEDNKKEVFVIDKSLTPQTKIENEKEVLAVQYYKRDDIYISEDTSGLLQKGASWNMNAEAIPHSVTLSERAEVEYMKELKGFGRDTNTLNGLIVDLNRLMATDKPDTRDRSTVQGAINYLNDTAIKIHTLTPGKFPVIDHYGRLNSGEMDLDNWIDVKFDPNVDKPRMIIRHIFNSDDIENTQRDLNIVEEGQEIDDTITYPTYKFDDMGHQVNTKPTLHTITLPYSFKTIKATNTNDDAVNGPAIEINEEGQIADNTQDTLTFSASNRWVKFDNNTEDTVKVGHLLSPFIDETAPNKLYGLTQNEDYTKAVNDLGDLDKDNTFEVPCFQFDEAGHILEARTHTVTIPENFTKHVNTLSDVIDVDNTVGTVGEINPDTLTDALTFAEGNRWINIAADADNDKFTFSHYVKNFDETTSTLDFNNTDNGKTFTVQSIGWDRAGHLISSDKKTFTLPDNFKVVEVSEQSTSTENSLNGQKGTIVADNLVDTLTLKSGNKWIQLFGNADDDSVTFRHYVNKFTETTATTDNNVLADNTISTQELTWDEAGHLIGSNKRTYTLPYNFKTFTVSNNDGKDNVDLATAADGSLIAGNQIDEMTFASGNRWMTLIADVNSKKVTLAHAKAGTASVSKGDTANQTPAFGSTFKVLSAGIDQTGHVSSLEEHTVQIPLASLNNETVGGVDSVLTKLSLEPTTGAFTTEHKNVGELLITGYSVATENSAISATDSINSAFGKIQKALDTLNANSETAGSVAKSVKDLKDELQDNCSERFNTLAKIESDINDGSETTLVERVQDLEKRALPHYDELENEGVYLMKMIDGQPNWIKLATWTGGTY